MEKQENERNVRDFFNVHIMNIDDAKFQKKFDSRTISRELP